MKTSCPSIVLDPCFLGVKLWKAMCQVSLAWLLKVWSESQQHPCHLGAHQKGRLSAPILIASVLEVSGDYYSLRPSSLWPCSFQIYEWHLRVVFPQHPDIQEKVSSSHLHHLWWGWLWEISPEGGIAWKLPLPKTGGSHCVAMASPAWVSGFWNQFFPTCPVWAVFENICFCRLIARKLLMENRKWKLTEIGVGWGGNQLGKGKSFRNEKQHKTRIQESGSWKGKFYVILASWCHCSQSSDWPTREAKGRARGRWEGPDIILWVWGSAFCVQHEVRENKEACLSNSLQWWLCTPREGPTESLNTPSPLLGRPLPQPVFLWPPELKWHGKVSGLLAHLCSGTGGSGPPPHTSILQPILSCPGWLPSKAQHDRWMKFTRKLHNGPVFQECRWWLDSHMQPTPSTPGWMASQLNGAELVFFFSSPLSPVWILWLFRWVQVTPYSASRVPHASSGLRPQTHDPQSRTGGKDKCRWSTRVRQHEALWLL